MVGRTLVKGGPLSRADPGGILTSAVGAKGPHPWRTLPEDCGCPTEAVWCAEHDLAAVILFLSLREAFQAEDSPPLPSVFAFAPGFAFDSLTGGPRLFQKA